MAHESDIWRWWKKATQGVPGLHQTRVENSANRGVPDIEGCLEGNGWQIESKVLQGVRKDGSGGTLKFQIGQREWAYRRWRCGGRSYVLVGLDRELFLIPGLFANSLPLKGVVERMDLLSRCIMARTLKIETSAKRDNATASLLLGLLADPRLAGDLADQIAAEHPEFVCDARSPVQALLGSYE